MNNIKPDMIQSTPLNPMIIKEDSLLEKDGGLRRMITINVKFNGPIPSPLGNVYVYSNGNLIHTIPIIDAGSSINYFDNLPVLDGGGKLIIYTIGQDVLNDYEQVITGDMDNEFFIVNTYKGNRKSIMKRTTIQYLQEGQHRIVEKHISNKTSSKITRTLSIILREPLDVPHQYAKIHIFSNNTLLNDISLPIDGYSLEYRLNSLQAFDSAGNVIVYTITLEPLIGATFDLSGDMDSDFIIDIHTI